MKVLIQRKRQTRPAGFTLIEILVVIGIIAVLAAIVLVAINPARQFAQARNTERQSNVTAILDAIGQYTADHQGELPALPSGTPPEIDQALCEDLVDEYLPALPTDPRSAFEGNITDCSDAGGGNVDYEVTLETSGRVTVCAPNAADEVTVESPEPICLTR